MALRLGDILVEKKIITGYELEQAVKEQQKTKEALGSVLVRMGFISERQLLQILAEQQGIPFVEFKDIKIDDKAVKSVPAKFAVHYKVMPIAIDGHMLTIATSNPFDMWPVDDLETNLGFRVERVLSSSSDILEMIRKYYGVGADTIERILAEEPKEGRPDASPSEKVEDLTKMATDASVIKLVNQILQQAINDRATDIHIERFREELRLRYRIDGILYDTQIAGEIKYLYSAIISRIKIMSGLNIIERRIPQDGRAKVKIGNEEYDLRISILPTLYGENIVVRILPTTMLFNIAQLGLSKPYQEIFEQLLKKPHGIIFLTGPTGSGKTTTLYACLSMLNTRERKIITIEDPIEYELGGISQLQIKPAIGFTFATALRSVLRHDPDIIMVGEVRDFEAAEITIQTALTGHLVFSTLHTNDAATGATRLIDIGIEPYLVASSVEAFIAQRLVRVICEHCKADVTAQSQDAVKSIEKDLKMDRREIKIYKGKGCKACNFTGYMGRTAIYEILLVKDDIRGLINQKASSDIIRKKAVELGMNTLKQDGWAKVVEGVTTPEEVLRVTHLED
ncbi:MAG: ATPase, T2SS/T4P/T4SS family [Candidatus Omnitrophota bacterium]|jgi:type II secretory ATPase GspE/PulE/Tfp pilus assembly ATPase PilB-like protein